MTFDPGDAGHVHEELIEAGSSSTTGPGSGIRIGPHFFTTADECLAVLDEIEAIRNEQMVTVGSRSAVREPCWTWSARSALIVGRSSAVTLIFVPGLLHPNKSQRFQAVAYADYVAGFRQVTGLAALVPAGLPNGWYANSADLTAPGRPPTCTSAGSAPTNQYAALEESIDDAQRRSLQAMLGAPGLRVCSSHRGLPWRRCGARVTPRRTRPRSSRTTTDG